MKIIGRTVEGLLLSASSNELANFVGFYYSGQEGCPDFICGMEVIVSPMYEQLRSIQANKDQLGIIATKLRMVADLLQVNEPLLLSKTEAETAA